MDYTKVLAPVARLDIVQILLAITAQHGWEVLQLDAKSVFLHCELKEEMYIQHDGFIKEGHEEKVYRLRKALYDLKQAPRAWYSKIETYFAKENFEKCPNEHTLFTKKIEGNILIVSLYVDDLIFTGNNRRICEQFKSLNDVRV